MEPGATLIPPLSRWHSVLRIAGPLAESGHGSEIGQPTTDRCEYLIRHTTVTKETAQHIATGLDAFEYLGDSLLAQARSLEEEGQKTSP